MSPALLALSACTFALGFAEFVAISLVPSIASSTGLQVGSVGFMVGIYAIGVSIGAPVLSAMLANASRKKVLAAGMWLFVAANVLTATTTSLPLLLGSRLVAGLMHGLVLALAASTAAAAAGKERSGAAIATVFGGLTLALLLGVPLGTLAGGTFKWQYVFLAIATIGGVGAVALMLFAPSSTPRAATEASASPSVWSTVSDRRTLHPVLITALTYAGSFTGFTYISVLLENATGLGTAGVTGMFVLYGASAAVGNTLGGRFVDRFGSRVAVLSVISGLGLALVLAWLGSAFIAVMALSMLVWGLASFAAVPVLQKTVLVAAQQNPAGSPELASGMNIAAFNVGIAAGSSLGGLASSVSPLAPMAAGLAPLVLALAFAFLLRKADAAHRPLTSTSPSTITNQGI